MFDEETIGWAEAPLATPRLAGGGSWVLPHFACCDLEEYGRRAILPPHEVVEPLRPVWKSRMRLKAEAEAPKGSVQQELGEAVAKPRSSPRRMRATTSGAASVGSLHLAIDEFAKYQRTAAERRGQRRE